MTPREKEIVNGWNEIEASSQFAFAYVVTEIGKWFRDDFANFWEDDFASFWEDDFVDFWE